jgi:hypothetical protein
LTEGRQRPCEVSFSGSSGRDKHLLLLLARTPGSSSKWPTSLAAAVGGDSFAAWAVKLTLVSRSFTTPA